MFIGHFAVGFAAKRAAPRLSLAVLFAAAQFADLLWPVLVALGIEQVRIQPGITAFTPLDFISYPYSHSLLLLCVWGAVFGAICAAVVRDRRVWFVVFALVVSHWVLDWITHRPDMPLYPGSAKVGLGLWNSIPGTIVVEVAMFILGVWIYARSRVRAIASGRARSRRLSAFSSRPMPLILDHRLPVLRPSSGSALRPARCSWYGRGGSIATGIR